MSPGGPGGGARGKELSEVSATSSSFSGDAEAYEGIMGRWSRRLAGPFIDFAGLAQGETILDVGCGTGSLTLAVAERAKVARVTGIDLSEAYIAFARGRPVWPPPLALSA